MKVQGVDQAARVITITTPGKPTGTFSERAEERPGAANLTMLEEESDAREGFSDQDLKQAVDKLNQTMRVYGTMLHFEIHKESGEIMVKVIDERDNSVIREIPPEKILNMVAYFKKLLGIIVDELI